MGKERNSKKPKILAITGKAAENIIKENCPNFVTVKTLPIDVAAFITKDLIKKNLTISETKGFDLILVPGFIQGDLTDLKEIYGIPIVKGPRYANDIKFAIVDNDPFSLSSLQSADTFLKNIKYKNSRDILSNAFKTPLNIKENEFLLGEGLAQPFIIGLNRPPLVMAEIVDAPLLSIEQIIERAKYYLANNVDIIDIGATVKSSNPEKIAEIIHEIVKLREMRNFLISIDTLDVDEIISAANAGVDLILSIDHSNIDALIDQIPRDLGIVIIPTNIKKGFMPKESKERVKSLFELKEKLSKNGFHKIFADPIIEMPIHPGFINSLESYIEFRKQDPITPMMTCIGNVTEFIEADPIGINALFGCIAVELGIQLLLATDVSVKCRGGVNEITKARDLAFVSKMRNSPPKGHGIDILFAKSRSGYDVEIPTSNSLQVLDLQAKDNNLYSLDYEIDPKGSFTIWTDYHKKKIYVMHLEPNSNQPDFLFIASNAREIIEELISRNFISKLDHAFYMGRELERAEVSLYLGKTYVQNEQPFKEKNIN